VVTAAVDLESDAVAKSVAAGRHVLAVHPLPRLR
jgi:hypothetical protein